LFNWSQSVTAFALFQTALFDQARGALRKAREALLEKRAEISKKDVPAE
jgi:hypothetical protein